MQRAVGVPVARSSYAVLYIDMGSVSFYYGVYEMAEDVGSNDFIASRLSGDGGSGNYYQLNYDVYLQYLGAAQSIYQNKTHTNSLGATLNNYDLVSGTQDWSDLVQFLAFVNTSSDADFAAHLGEHIEVESLLRQMVVESFLLAGDSFGPSGQNYYLYHREGVEQMQLVEVDFDEIFAFESSGAALEPAMPADIYTFFLVPDKPEHYNPLLLRMLALDQYRQQFQGLYKQFLEGIFGPASRIQPSQRNAQRLAFVYDWIARDKMWQAAELRHDHARPARVLAAHIGHAAVALRQRHCAACCC